MTDRALTPRQCERLAAWSKDIRQCAQLSNEALAAQVEEELCYKRELTSLQITILQEVCDRLRGLPPVIPGTREEP